MDNIKQAMDKAGLESMSTGGGCTGYVKSLTNVVIPIVGIIYPV